MEDTLVILKPDCVHRKLVSEVLRLLEPSFQIMAIKTVWLDAEDVDFLYGRYSGEDFYEALSNFMQSGPSHVICLRGEAAISRGRGALDSIRAVYANPTVFRENVIHGSDTSERAEEEIHYFFGREERYELGIDE
jgi:nucleoside-diphosphate kinase